MTSITRSFGLSNEQWDYRAIALDITEPTPLFTSAQFPYPTSSYDVQLIIFNDGPDPLAITYQGQQAPNQTASVQIYLANLNSNNSLTKEFSVKASLQTPFVLRGTPSGTSSVYGSIRFRRYPSLSLRPVP